MSEIFLIITCYEKDCQANDPEIGLMASMNCAIVRPD